MESIIKRLESKEISYDEFVKLEEDCVSLVVQSFEQEAYTAFCEYKRALTRYPMVNMRDPTTRYHDLVEREKRLRAEWGERLDRTKANFSCLCDKMTSAIVQLYPGNFEQILLNCMTADQPVEVRRVIAGRVSSSTCVHDYAVKVKVALEKEFETHYETQRELKAKKEQLSELQRDLTDTEGDHERQMKKKRLDISNLQTKIDSLEALRYGRQPSGHPSPV